MPTPGHDWADVEARAFKVWPEWLHVGDDVRYSTAFALRQGKMRISPGLEVQTRNTHHDEHGVRRCSLYVRKEPSHGR